MSRLLVSLCPPNGVEDTIPESGLITCINSEDDLSQTLKKPS